VYGALNFRHEPAGGASRFGSAHLRLTRDTLSRTTFCYPDSHLDPQDFGVATRMGLIDLAVADRRDDLDDCLDDLDDCLDDLDDYLDDLDDCLDDLDDYVEAQVHGPVRLGRDVEALVLDPCYRGTTVEAAALGLGCPVEWHPGFRLGVEELRRHPDYRGEEYVALGVEIAVDGVLDPRVVGDAVRAGHDFRAVKKVWHLVARFGAPARERG
jgi:hypothetical protein